MTSVFMRGLRLGEGRPAICIPLTATTLDDLEAEARLCLAVGPDVLEWRADFFDGLWCEAALDAALVRLRETIGETPLLFTVRSAGEGGHVAVDGVAYGRIVERAARSGAVDAVDIEAFFDESVTEAMVDSVHRGGCLALLSNHDFATTPSVEEIVARLRRMQDLGADICKVAVTPSQPADVLTLLSATREMYDRYATRPLVTMSMGRLGLVTRVAGGVFGSCLTFASGARASAPGQIPADRLRDALDLFAPDS